MKKMKKLIRILEKRISNIFKKSAVRGISVLIIIQVVLVVVLGAGVLPITNGNQIQTSINKNDSIELDSATKITNATLPELNKINLTIPVTTYLFTNNFSIHNIASPHRIILYSFITLHLKNTQQNPVENTQQNPVENTQQNPVENTQQNPVENIQQTPKATIQAQSIPSSSSDKIVNSQGHSWSIIGSNIQLAINDLGSTGGVVYLPVTTSLSNGKLDVSQIFIPYNNIRICGAGVDKTKLNFVGKYSFGIVASSNPGGSEENWKKGISNLRLDNFSFYGRSILLVIRSNCIVSNLNGYDIKGDWAAIRFVCPYGDMKSENLKIINCNILRSSSHGFQLNAVQLKGCVFDTVLFKGCSSTKAGCWEWSSHGKWAVGFDLAEGYGSASVKGGLTVKNLVVDHCASYEAWESGFHFENKPIKQNIVFTDCISNFNGQKYMRTSASSWSVNDIYGSGWLGMTSAMTLTRCTAKGNGAWGWYGESSPTTKDCIGDKYPTNSKGNGCGTMPKGYSGGLYKNCIIKVISSG
jgi:hypothetical protein